MLFFKKLSVILLIKKPKHRQCLIAFFGIKKYGVVPVRALPPGGEAACRNPGRLPVNYTLTTALQGEFHEVGHIFELPFGSGRVARE